MKIAAFDFDDTLITTKSGLKFARGEDDWKWWHASVPGRLKQLDAEGYAIVIISNQGAITLSTANSKAPKLDMKSLGTFKGKVLAVLNALELPISVYAATEKDLFRKPRTGMWDQLLQDYGLSDSAGEVDHANSIFVGDAAGRAEDKALKARKDHASSDRDFAANVGIQFHTPEEFFLHDDPRPFVRTFEPSHYFETANGINLEASPIRFQKKHDVELVLFCGSPGAGKSTFYWTHLKPLGYERVNQDVLKTRERCMKAATQYLDDKTSVVVDNTNADIETRASWMALARRIKVPVRLVHFTASAKLCEHNDTVRALTGVSMNPEGRTMLPKMAFHGYASRYREPRLEEGFEDIASVDFKVCACPSSFKTIFIGGEDC